VTRWQTFRLRPDEGPNERELALRCSLEHADYVAVSDRPGC
jgi:hypothetical protein